MATLLALSACSGGDDPAADSPSVPEEPTWNPCDALAVADVTDWFGGGFTKDAGTEAAPKCTFAPASDGGPVIDANYLLFAGGLDEAFAAMADLDPDDVRVVQVPGADAAKVVVDFDDSQLFVSGFVQNGDLVQTVDVIDPQPYDQARVVRGVREVLAAFSAAAP